MAIYLGAQKIKLEGMSHVFLGNQKIYENAVWKPMSSTETIPMTTTNTTDGRYIYEPPIVTQGSAGSLRHDWEELYVNGVSTGQKRNESSTTIKAMVPTTVRRGSRNYFTAGVRWLEGSGVSFSAIAPNTTKKLRINREYCEVQRGRGFVREDYSSSIGWTYVHFIRDTSQNGHPWFTPISSSSTNGYTVRLFFTVE